MVGALPSSAKRIDLIMGRRYENSPIVEAICEFHFAPDTLWDLTSPGIIYEKIQDIFPRRNQVAQINAAVVGNVESIVQQIGTIPLMQFLREDGNSLIQVGQNLLTINHLKPYSSWQEFLPLIEKSLQVYKAVVQPKQLSRVAVRYINRIEVENDVDLKEYFNFRPFLGEELPQKYNAFVVGVLLPQEGSKDNLNLQLGTINAETPDTLAVVLDINYFIAQPEEVGLDNVMEWINTAHKHIEDIFEACITNKLRHLFKEVK